MAKNKTEQIDGHKIWAEALSKGNVADAVPVKPQNKGGSYFKGDKPKQREKSSNLSKYDDRLASAIDEWKNAETADKAEIVYSTPAL